MALSVQRQVAIKCGISTLLSGNYVKEEGLNPNYIKTEFGNISRAHLVGVAVHVASEQEFIMDDGTGKLTVRAFNNDLVLPQVGELIRCIGRPREYQNNRYLMPEIIKPLNNPIWAQLHKRECKTIPLTPSIVEEVGIERNAVKEETIEEGGLQPIAEKSCETIPANPQPVLPQAPIIEKQPEKLPTDPNTLFYTLVKTLDKGEGADYEQVLGTSQLKNGEEVIQGLMREGEIFLIAPGKLKVLE